MDAHADAPVAGGTFSAPGRAAYARRLAVLVGLFVGLCAVAVLLGKLLFSGPLQAEVRFLQWLASSRSAPLTTMEQAITFLGSTLWLLGLSVLVGAWLLLKRRIVDLLILLAAGFGSSAITNLVKVVVARPRPGVVPHLAATSTLGFPSGHACSSAAVYVALALVLPASRSQMRIAIAAAVLLLAIAVASSRLYLGVHYPSDVLAGLALGGLWATAACVVLRSLEQGDRGPDREPVEHQ